MIIMSIEGTIARCQRQGTERDVDVFLIADYNPLPGEYVPVHVGYSVQKSQKKRRKLAGNYLTKCCLYRSRKYA